MTLATGDSEGRLAARVVLLKQADERGFVFFTNYGSRKARDLAANPRAALLFHWSSAEWERQVRVEGDAERVTPAESDAYFATRPRDAQVGALASRQSDPLRSRAELDERLAELEGDLAGAPVPRPPTWGGYLVVPAAWEFWQHRASRLHDRFRYERDSSGGWRIERLFP